MICCKPQADSSAQTTAIAKSDGEPHLVVVAASGEEVACFRLGVRVRNAQRGSSDVTRSDERHQLRDVVFGEWTQFQPLGFESRRLVHVQRARASAMPASAPPRHRRLLLKM